MKVSYSQMMKSMSGANDLAPSPAEIETEIAADILRAEIAMDTIPSDDSISKPVKILKAPDEDIPF